MMANLTTLTFKQPHNLAQLYDELIAAVPSLRPVPVTDPMLGSVLQAVMTVSGDGETLYLGVPTTSDRAAITRVVEAHVPDPGTEG